MSPFFRPLRASCVERSCCAASTGPAVQNTGGGRTAGDLLMAAEAGCAERQRRKGELELAERKRREQAAAAAREWKGDVGRAR